MQISENYELEHRRPFKFSGTAAALLLVSIFSGIFAWLIVNSELVSFLQLFLATIALFTGVLAGARYGLYSKRHRNGALISIKEKRGKRGADLAIDLEEFLAATTSLVAIVKLNGDQLDHIYDNQAASRFLSRGLEGRSGSSTTPHAQQPVESIWYEQCLESQARNAPVRFEFQTEKPGQRQWFSACVFPIHDGAKNTDMFAIQAEEITQLKENESKLVEARERLSAALATGSLATWEWDIQRDVVYGDPVLIDFYGMPTDYLRGASVAKFLDHIYPEDRERIQQRIQMALQSGEIYSEEYRVVGKNGQVRWVSATGKVLADTSGKPARFPGVTVDITRRKEAEAALQQATIASRNQLQELESVYTYAPVGLAVVDEQRRWVRVNKVMADYFGKRPEDFIGKSIRELVPMIADVFDLHLQKAIATRGAVLNVEMSGECPITPGSIRTWSTNFYPLITPEDRIIGVNIVTDDITEDRRSMEEHRAHRAILDVDSPAESLEKVLNSFTVAVEGIFPGAESCILKASGAKMLTPLMRMSSPVVEKLFSKPFSIADLKVVSDVIEKREEVLISDISDISASGFIERVREAGYRSCWIRPIILSNGEVWGALAIHHTTIKQKPTQSERDHLDVLVRLAATLIERKAFLEQLTTTTERLQYAERAGRIGVFDWNPQTGTVIWTPQLEEIFGLSVGTFEGSYEGWRKRVHPDDVEMVAARLNKLIADKERSFKYEYRIIHLSGEVRWNSDQGELSYDKDGHATRMIGVVIDITERKKIEEEVKRSQERLNLALEAGNLGLWDWHIPTGVVNFGGTWASMIGYRPDEIEPHVRAWEELVHPDDRARVERELKKHLEGLTSVYEVEHRLRSKSGAWIWILDRGRVVERDSQGKAIRAVGIHADIHEQRMIREKLNSEARKKDEFIATLAHELRNPLAPIRTGLEIIKRDPSGPTAIQAREMMSRQLLHMVRLIEDLLDISRISLGRLELRIEKITLKAVVDSALESSRPAIEAAMHQLAVRLPREEVYLKGDLARLSQVLSNLLINAAKYTPPGGKISLIADLDGNEIVIRVVDTGIGIPPDKLSEIFEMFSQVYSPLDRTQGGLGIGLALVRRVVQMHGGHVHGESDGLGKGSTFTVRLPASKDQV
jgi:PAS domain S-box-containing protein